MSGESLRLCGALVASEGKGPSWVLVGDVLVSLVTRKDEHWKKSIVFF